MATRLTITEVSHPDELEVFLDDPLFTSLDDVPIWTPDSAYPDNDDSVLANYDGQFVPEPDSSGASPVIKLSATPKAVVNKAGKFVPFIRMVKLNSKGPDTVAYKRAISTWAAKSGHPKLFPWQKTWPVVFGATAVKALKAFQAAHGLKADGQIGPATHAKLAFYVDSRGIFLLHQVPTTSPQKQAQLLMQAAMVLTYNMRWNVHYTQGPWRMYGVRHHLLPPHYGSYEDCSSMFTWNCYVGKLRDPNNLGYDGYGFTGTIGTTCPTITDPIIGAASLYGSRPYKHVTTVYGKKSDGSWVEHSHGSEAGPVWVKHNYRGDFAHYGNPFR